VRKPHCPESSWLLRLAAHEEAVRAADQHREITDDHDLADVVHQRDTDTIEAVAADEFVEAELVNNQVTSHADGTEDDDNTRREKTDQTANANAQLDTEQLEALAPSDIRQTAADEERILESDTTRVPAADETAEAVRRAQRALIEIQQRRAADEDRAADEATRDDDLTRWHTDDTSAGQTDTAAADDSGPAMALGRYDD
jgi:hypothetical protein